MIERKSESTVFPLELETTQTTVYVRTNIVAEERINQDESTLTMFVYDETQYTRAEYESLVVAQTRADVDYIAIMQGVEL